MRIEPADDAMFGERDAWRYERPYDFYGSDGLPVKNPEFFFAARDDDGIRSTPSIRPSRLTASPAT